MRNNFIRFMSFFYDALLCSAIAFVAGFCFIYLFGDATVGVKRTVFTCYIYLCIASYFVYCWTHGGQTLGLKTWRLCLQTKSAQPLNRAMAIQRYLYATLSLSLFGAGFLWRFVDADQQYLHDRLLGLEIIKMTRA